MRSSVILAVSFAAVVVGLSGCKAELGEASSDDSSSSLLSTLADMEGYQYYKHENMCNEFPDLCKDNSATTSILENFNDPAAEADSYGQEEGIDANGDDALDAIGVDSDGDGVFDFVVADMDGDGIFDSILVRDPGSIDDASTSNDGESESDNSICYTAPWDSRCEFQQNIRDNTDYNACTGAYISAKKPCTEWNHGEGYKDEWSAGNHDGQTLGSNGKPDSSTVDNENDNQDSGDNGGKNGHGGNIGKDDNENCKKCGNGKLD